MYEIKSHRKIKVEPNTYNINFTPIHHHMPNNKTPNPILYIILVILGMAVICWILL